MIKSALAVYHWFVRQGFVRQALIGSRVVARKPSGEEVAIETAELAVLQDGNRLSPEELGLLAKRLAKASYPVEAARTKSVSLAASMVFSAGEPGIPLCLKSAVRTCRPRFFSICWIGFKAEKFLPLNIRTVSEMA